MRLQCGGRVLGSVQTRHALTDRKITPCKSGLWEVIRRLGDGGSILVSLSGQFSPVCRVGGFFPGPRLQGCMGRAAGVGLAGRDWADPTHDDEAVMVGHPASQRQPDR